MIPNNVCVGVSLGPAKELLHVPVHFDGEYPRPCSKGSKKRCAQGSSKKQSRKDCRLILVKLPISSLFHFCQKPINHPTMRIDNTTYCSK